jgi:hypothetical protein
MSEATAERLSRLAAKRSANGEQRAPEHASERLPAGYPGRQRASHRGSDESGQA